MTAQTKPAIIRVIVAGSYMFNPQASFLAKLLRTQLGVENLDGVQLLTTDSKGVVAAARAMVENSTNVKGRVFEAKADDGTQRWSKRTDRMVKAADHVLILDTVKEGVSTNEAAYIIQAAKKASVPVKIYRTV